MEIIRRSYRRTFKANNRIMSRVIYSFLLSNTDPFIFESLFVYQSTWLYRLASRFLLDGKIFSYREYEESFSADEDDLKFMIVAKTLGGRKYRLWKKLCEDMVECSSPQEARKAVMKEIELQYLAIELKCLEERYGQGIREPSKQPNNPKMPPELRWNPIFQKALEYVALQ